MSKEGDARSGETVDQKIGETIGKNPGLSTDQEAAPEAQSLAHPLTVVGIGASAGGLEALGSLLGELELDNTAFVVVQHLAPDHDSMLTELLARVTKMKVVTITDGMPMVHNVVYVIPPDTDLAVLHGVLHLMPPPTGRGPRLAIDFFFRSLAADKGQSAIGVILSGAGTDGTFGLKAIKAEGGITFVQDPATARHDGMPRSALGSGYADFCMSAAAIGREISRVTKHPYLARAAASGLGLRQEHLSKIFILIRKEFGNDLTHYKHSTIERRIERRMALHKIEELSEYVRYLQANPAELAVLYKEMLISVTSFFRDRTPFDFLKSDVFPRMMEQKRIGDSIRVWTAGCSTGEEAYSVAIALLEFLGDSAVDYKIQFFGTDIDNSSVQIARRGVYPQNIALDVSNERLHRFFRKHESNHQVSRVVRDMLVFAPHNLTKDAPYSHIDLVTCRNVLIYLQPVLQKKVLRILHYSLNPGGILMLGTSETVGDSPDLFALIDRKNKVYSRKNITSVVAFEFNLAGNPETTATQLPAPPRDPRPIVTAQQLADRKLLDRYAPPGVLLNENLEILQFRGRTAPYLEASPGMASLHIMKHIRPELQGELRTAVQRAIGEGIPIVTAEIALRSHDGAEPRSVAIEVIPLNDPGTRSNCLLVVFREDLSSAKKPRPPDPSEAVSPAGQLTVQDIERELQATKEFLQNTVEELEAANEELQSSNEELQSSNEELQSTNEELETSKEELQSSNEELTTVNDELLTRMGELSQSNDDLGNVLSGIEAAVLIVGMDLRIRRFSRVAEKLLNLVTADLGRPISYLAASVKNLDVEATVTDVISRATAVQHEVTIGPRWYSLRVSPYMTDDHSIRGAVLGFAELEHGRGLDQSLAAAEYASTLLVAVKHALLILDERMRMVWANAAFYRTFGIDPSIGIGDLAQRLDGQRWAPSRLIDLVKKTLSSGLPFKDFAFVYHSGPVEGGADGERAAKGHEAERVGQRKIWVGGSIIPSLPSEANQRLVLVVIEDEASHRRGDSGGDRDSQPG
jgi:two-component system CheB/CheR fusion protein